MKIAPHPIGPRGPFVLGLVLSLAALLRPGNVQATTYYFANAGSDTNPGTDSNFPLQSLDAASIRALPGNTLLFNRGDFWYNTAESFDLQSVSGTATNRIVIDAYGLGTKPLPIIGSMYKLSNMAGPEGGQWALDHGTVWKVGVPFSHALRLFVGTTSRYMVNRVDPTKNESNVTSTTWFLKPLEPGSSGALYVDSGSTSVPPQNCEMIPMGAVTTMKMKYSNHVTIRNIDFRGGSAANVILIDAPCSDIIIEYCTIQKANGGGIIVNNTGSVTTDVNADITVRHNTLDKVWSTAENGGSETPAYPFNLRGDGVFFLHAVDGGLIQDNVITNWGHTGVTVTAFRPGFYGAHDVIVETNRVSAGASAYMHGFDMSGLEGLTTRNTIRRNWFHDYTSTCHVLGNNNFIYSNIFSRVTKTVLNAGGSVQPYGMDMISFVGYKGSNADTSTWLYMVSHDNLVAQNTFESVEQYPILLDNGSGPTSVVYNNQIYNNLFVDYGNPSAQQVGILIGSNVTGSTFMRYNDFWDSGAVDPNTAGVVRVSTTTYTASALNLAFPTTCTGNSQVNPVLFDAPNNKYYTTTNNALVRASTNHLSTTLVPVDYNGISFASQPTLGAIQWVP